MKLTLCSAQWLRAAGLARAELVGRRRLGRAGLRGIGRGDLRSGNSANRYGNCQFVIVKTGLAEKPFCGGEEKAVVIPA